jgi:DNA-binding phage protein
VTGELDRLRNALTLRAASRHELDRDEQLVQRRVDECIAAGVSMARVARELGVTRQALSQTLKRREQNGHQQP